MNQHAFRHKEFSDKSRSWEKERTQIKEKEAVEENGSEKHECAHPSTGADPRAKDRSFRKKQVKRGNKSMYLARAAPVTTPRFGRSTMDAQGPHRCDRHGEIWLCYSRSSVGFRTPVIVAHPETSQNHADLAGLVEINRTARVRRGSAHIWQNRPNLVDDGRALREFGGRRPRIWPLAGRPGPKLPKFRHNRSQALRSWSTMCNKLAVLVEVAAHWVCFGPKLADISGQHHIPMLAADAATQTSA